VVGPNTNELVFPDSQPRLFSWNRGNAQQFTLQWSRNPQFAIVTETSGEVLLQSGGDIQVYDPDAQLWGRILLLAQSPDFRETPIFWRIIPDNVPAQNIGQLEVRALRMAAAQPPTLTFPPPGAEFQTNQPPTLTWDANHNERYRVRFAATPYLGWPRVDSGAEFEITGTNWTVPDATWAEVVNLSQSGSGTIYYVLFGRDALDRQTFSRVRSLSVLQGAPVPPTGGGFPPPEAGGRQAGKTIQTFWWSETSESPGKEGHFRAVSLEQVFSCCCSTGDRGPAPRGIHVGDPHESRYPAHDRRHPGRWHAR